MREIRLRRFYQITCTEMFKLEKNIIYQPALDPHRG